MTDCSIPRFSSKAAWRQWAKRQRRCLDIQSLSGQICTHLSRDPLFARARQVLMYLPLPSEIDLHTLAQGCSDKIWGVPRCLPETQLSWHRWCPSDWTGLTEGLFGLTEPAAELPELDPAQVDLVLVPGLAFDIWGGRLGYGKGYYDRFLARYPWVHRFGICPHQCLLSTPLPSEAWDVSMTGIVTEWGVFSVQEETKAR